MVASEYQERVRLHDPKEFDKRFIEKTRESDTYEEAYFEVEKEHKSVFGANKYSNYESYRVSRYKRIKNNQKT